MNDVLGRLLPAVRDVRTPLALGYSLILIAWAALTVGRDSGKPDPVVDLYRELSDDLPAIVEFGAVTFVATLIGSGLVRLVDRFMQMTATRRKDRHNPLDSRPPLAREGEDGQDNWLPGLFRKFHRILDPEWDEDEYPTDFLAEFVKNQKPSWSTGDIDYAHDRDQFLFHLRQDQEFGALRSEQLMRAVMFLPAGLGLVLCISWAVGSWDWSIGALIAAILVLLAVLWLDYGRIGTLMHDRWVALAHEWPTWIPIEYQTHRNASAVAIEQDARNAMDRIHSAWRDVVTADASRRRKLREGDDDDSELSGALTGLGQHLSNLGILPLGDEVDVLIRKVDTASNAFAQSVRGDPKTSILKRGKVGDEIVGLNAMVRRRVTPDDRHVVQPNARPVDPT